MKRKEKPLRCADCANMIEDRYYVPVCYHIPGYEGKAYEIKPSNKACRLFDEKRKDRVS